MMVNINIYKLKKHQQHPTNPSNASPNLIKNSNERKHNHNNAMNI